MTEEINVNLPGDYQIAGVNAFVSGYCPNCKEKKNSRFKMSILQNTYNIMQTGIWKYR